MEVTCRAGSRGCGPRRRTGSRRRRRRRTGVVAAALLVAQPPPTSHSEEGGRTWSTMREIVHIQAGQCGNQIGAKVPWSVTNYLTFASSVHSTPSYCKKISCSEFFSLSSLPICSFLIMGCMKALLLQWFVLVKKLCYNLTKVSNIGCDNAKKGPIITQFVERKWHSWLKADQK